MVEYHLQKRTLSMWQYVTWYETEEEAKKNYNRAVASETGYSWRYVKVETIEEHINGGEVELQPDSDEALEISNQEGWGKDWSKPIKPHNDSDWSAPAPKSHGLAGKVWLANKELKQKKRVDPSEVDAMINQGWFKAGPRTQV